MRKTRKQTDGSNLIFGLDLSMFDKKTMSPWSSFPLLPPSSASSTLLWREGRPRDTKCDVQGHESAHLAQSGTTVPLDTLPHTRPAGGLALHTALQMQMASMAQPIPSTHIPNTTMSRTSLAFYMWAPISSLALAHELITCLLSVDSELHTSLPCVW